MIAHGRLDAALTQTLTSAIRDQALHPARPVGGGVSEDAAAAYLHGRVRERWRGADERFEGAFRASRFILPVMLNEGMLMVELIQAGAGAGEGEGAGDATGRVGRRSAVLHDAIPAGLL